jgi:hypothetical protein
VGKEGEEIIAAWETPFYEWEERDSRLAQIDEARWVAEPEPAGPHYVTITASRLSSGDIQEQIRFLNGAPAVAQKHERWLLRGLLPQHAAQLPDGARPGGTLTTRRNFYLVFAHQGTRPIPVAAGNQLQQPSLRAFVIHIQEIIRPNNPNPPVETFFLLRGLAGISVDIRGWGDCTPNSGIFYTIWEADQKNGTNLLDTVYICVAVEPHVVDGVGEWSLNHPHQSPGYHGYNG